MAPVGRIINPGWSWLCSRRRISNCWTGSQDAFQSFSSSQYPPEPSSRNNHLIDDPHDVRLKQSFAHPSRKNNSPKSRPIPVWDSSFDNKSRSKPPSERAPFPTPSNARPSAPRTLHSSSSTNESSRREGLLRKPLSSFQNASQPSQRPPPSPHGLSSSSVSTPSSRQELQTSSSTQERAAASPLVSVFDPSITYSAKLSSPLSLPTRLAFRALPSSVALLTVRAAPYEPGTPLTSNMHGMVISSLTSVSLSPYPVLSFNIKRPSSTLDAIYRAATQEIPFYIGLPSQSPVAAQVAAEFAKGDYVPPSNSSPNGTLSQQDSSSFTSNHSAKFDRVARCSPEMSLRKDGAGCYYINSVIPAVFSCEVMPEKCVHVGDHDILVARVLRVEYMCDVDTDAKDEETVTNRDSGFGKTQDIEDVDTGKVDGTSNTSQPIRQRKRSLTSTTNSPTPPPFISQMTTTPVSLSASPPPSSSLIKSVSGGEKMSSIPPFKPTAIDPNTIIPFQGLLYGNGAFRNWDGQDVDLDPVVKLDSGSGSNSAGEKRGGKAEAMAAKSAPGSRLKPASKRAGEIKEIVYKPKHKPVYFLAEDVPVRI